MRLPVIAVVISACAAIVWSAGTSAQTAKPAGKPAHDAQFFATSDQCMACHNGLKTPAGEDVSIGSSWRASMMANASRDPYWQAGVRRETLDHPAEAAAIQDECATCHMPMSRTQAHTAGRPGGVFEHLPVAGTSERDDLLAHDGVSCSMCHQITERNLGTPESFTGRYVVNPTSTEPRSMFGPFQIEKGLSTIMRSSTGFQPTEAAHIRQSELCATCHTLITKALGPQGQIVGELTEQAIYLEWRHSAFESEQRSCQSCHMPAVEEETPIASVLGSPRKGFARHSFVGGNFFMLRMLGRYRDELGVTALPDELEAAARNSVKNLQTSTAAIAIERAAIAEGRLEVHVTVRNLSGHKLPTAYPSRRAWLHVTVRDRSGRVTFESGAIAPSGAIQGNDSDSDPTRVEPHYTEIRQSDQVQIYESVMADSAGRPTTGLLSAVGYLKDNRLLPRGFDKGTAEPRIAPVGGAEQDVDFVGERDRVRYVLAAPDTDGPYKVDVELRFQVVGFRWADNLRAYTSKETTQFVGYYDSMASSSSEVLASATAASSTSSR